VLDVCDDYDEPDYGQRLAGYGYGRQSARPQRPKFQSPLTDSGNVFDEPLGPGSSTIFRQFSVLCNVFIVAKRYVVPFGPLRCRWIKR